MRTPWDPSRGPICGGPLTGNFHWQPTTSSQKAPLSLPQPLASQTHHLQVIVIGRHNLTSLFKLPTPSPFSLPSLPPSAENKAAAARHSGSSGSSCAGTGSGSGPHQLSPHNLTPAHPQTAARMNQFLAAAPPPGAESPGNNSNTNNNPVNGAAVHPYPVMRMKHSLSTSSGFTSVSQQNLRMGHPAMPPDRISLRSEGARGGGLGIPGNLGASRESFQEALDNPCEYFIDVM